ncbi:chemocyanin-like [Panicum miliaceum]|uniref:Chemocyanin-like n=1 Tax=Panicum miliaceum TaxID=4540 RepID=A0A3L6PLB4_PANMI|nr:chemocyanin-like [Panicum miliaceum]
MAARLQASLLAVAVIAAAAAVFATPAPGANYTVGAPGGSWDLRTDLADWASSIDFRPGDQLVFSYDASAHDVVEVTREGYRSCSAASPVSAALRTGSDAVELGGNGWRYFICGVQGHCAAGMKLQVRVSDAECTWTMPPPAPPGAPSGINLCPGGPPTVIMTPGVISHGSGAAPVSSASLTSLLVTMVSLCCLLASSLSS